MSEELNKKNIIYNLQEAEEEIQLIMQKIKNPHYTHEDLYRSMQHLIHHVNIAWNSRSSNKEIIELEEEEMKKWSQFPTDIKLI